MSDLVVAVLIAAVGGGGLSAIVIKLMDKKASDVTTLREIIAEVRDDKARDEQRISHLEQRVRKLEERERHMLTRAAVHEAWDQMAFQTLLRGDTTYPPPPPLRPSAITAKRDGLEDDGDPA